MLSRETKEGSHWNGMFPGRLCQLERTFQKFEGGLPTLPKGLSFGQPLIRPLGRLEGEGRLWGLEL